MIAPPGVRDRQVDGQPREERGLILLTADEVELQPILPRRQRSIEEVTNAPVGIGQGLGHPDRRGADVQPVERDAHALGRHAAFGVEDVGRDRRTRRWDGRQLGLSGDFGQRYPPIHG